MSTDIMVKSDAFHTMLAREQAGFRLTKDDVFGRFNDDYQRIDDGMLVARSEQVCPIWGDILPYKSVTVVVPELDVHDGKVREVEYWLMFVHGGDSISKRKSMPDGSVAIRSNYMAW